MAKLNISIDELPDFSNNFEPLPVGDYLVAITNSDFKAAKSGKGRYISLTMEVLEGDYKGRKLFYNLNVQHENEKAQMIGQSQLKKVIEAVGKDHISATEDLHDIPFYATVKIKEDQDGFLNNKIVKVLPKKKKEEEKKVIKEKKDPFNEKNPFNDDKIPF